MVAIVGWIGAMSGLPSLRVEGPGIVRTGDRILARFGDGVHLVADALAVPGTELTYEIDGAAPVHLMRPWPPREFRAGVYVADSSGRGAPGLFLHGNQDPVSWDSTVTRHETGAMRWALHDKPTTGTYVIDVHPDHEPTLWGTLRSREPITVVPAAPTTAVPPRTVIVESASRKRIVDDLVEVSVSWTEATGPALARASRIAGGGEGAVPVVTWGEWEAWGRTHDPAGWQAWSALEVASRVQDMPA